MVIYKCDKCDKESDILLEVLDEDNYVGQLCRNCYPTYKKELKTHIEEETAEQKQSRVNKFGGIFKNSKPKQIIKESDADSYLKRESLND